MSAREWFRRRFRIPDPEQAPVEMEKFDSAHTVSLVLELEGESVERTSNIAHIDEPQHHLVLTLVRSKATTPSLRLEPPDCHEYPHTRLSPPDQKVKQVRHLAQPASIDAFDALLGPGRAGKAYGSDSPAQALHSPSPSSERCKHGMLRRVCGLCRQGSSARCESVRQVTVDVFDLVLPLLYPPIGPDSPLAVVFPPNKQPYPFQYEGIRFLADRTGALLGDEMGLGKTIQAIVAMRVLVRQGSVKQTLILCPRSMLGTWEHELREWAPELSLQRVRGTIPERKQLWRSRAHVMLTTYETLRNDMANTVGLGSKFDLVILDEVQRIKNSSTKLARACQQLQASHRWGLSGTPLENSIEDVVSIYSYLQPGLLSSHNGWYSPLMIREEIRPHFLRRRTADVLEDLPEKVTEEIWLDLTDQQRAAYRRALQRGVGVLQGHGATRIHVFSLINELKQVCNWDTVSETSCKLEYLTDQLDLIASSHEKALVFSHYPNKSLVEIMPKLHTFAPAMFDGSMSDAARETIIRGFIDQETPRVLLASVKAGGVGLTLTRANHVFHYDHWWNPAVANQATGRAHRIGQTRTVFEYHFYATDTIEEKIYHLLKRKQDLFDRVIDDISEEDFARRISDEELFGLFDLKPPSATGGDRQSAVPTVAMTPAHSPKTAPKQTRTRPENSAQPNPPRRNSLERLSPDEFRRLVVLYYEKSGFSVQVAYEADDRVTYLVARGMQQTDAETRLVIMCQGGSAPVVRASAVRPLIAVSEDSTRATGLVIATSGAFTYPIRALAASAHIDLIDGETLHRELVRVGLL